MIIGGILLPKIKLVMYVYCSGKFEQLYPRSIIYSP